MFKSIRSKKNFCKLEIEDLQKFNESNEDSTAKQSTSALDIVTEDVMKQASKTGLKTEYIFSDREITRMKSKGNKEFEQIVDYVESNQPITQKPNDRFYLINK